MRKPVLAMPQTIDQEKGHPLRSMSFLRESLSILLIAVIPALATALWHPKKPEWNPSQLQEGEITLVMTKKLDHPILWVDARSPLEFEKGHIPNALRLNEQDWNQLITPFLEKWTPNQHVVVYCSTACKSSYHIASRLREMGISPTFTLKGGWEEWKKDHSF